MTRAGHGDVEVGELPEILVSPPWLRGKRSRPVVIEVAVEPRPVRLDWLPGERQEWADIAVQRTASDDEWRREIDRVAADLDYPLITALSEAPDHLVREHLDLLDMIPVNRRFGLHIPYFASDPPRGQQNDPHRRLLGRFGEDVLDFVIGAALYQESYGAPLLMPLAGTEVTAWMIAWLEKGDSLAATARAWFTRHTAAAVPDVIPAAVGKGVKARREAEAVLWMLDQAGNRELIRTAAAEFGAEVAAAIDAMLDRDPLLRLPTRIPKSPEWLTVSSLPRIRLRDSVTVLPDAEVEHLISMFMMCSPGDDYAGVRVAAQELDSASLGEFVWAVYRAWQAAKYPAKRNMWPMRALGLVGDDETAARLRGIAERDRAVNRSGEALEMLVLIGTRNAHMHIQLARENTVWPEVREQADRIIRELSADLGITVSEFADRAVPDLGLSPQGTLIVDYGPRQFVITLDEQLKPVVREEDGEERSSLPKPGKNDDPIAAPAAYTAFGTFKKALQAAITDQSTRMESAMVAGRRWSVAAQRRLFIDHPLLRQLSERLVWAAFDASGGVVTTFRVDSVGALADVHDAPLELSAELEVGIAHPLHLDESLPAWAELFADYGIVQPFDQLGRPSFGPNAPEVTGGLERYRGAVVSTGTVLGLNRFGWAKGYGPEGAVVRFTRTLAGTHTVRLYISPGIDGRNPMGTAVQTIESVVLPDDVTVSALDPIVASELIRELETLR